MQIKGFHRINGESRMPTTTEHEKHLKWNNNLGVFEYVTVEDNHIIGVTQVGGDVTITMNDGTTYSIVIPDMVSFTLPGDKKVLFDEDGIIGGRTNLTFNYDTTQLILTDFSGVFAKSTTFDATNQSILQYLGQNSLFVNFGSDKLESDMKRITAIGYKALSGLITGSDTIAIGAHAGENVSSDSSNNIFIGTYAGRLEPDDNKLYIHNKDYNSLQEFRDNSLLYGDFDIGLLYVNDSLHIREEVRIGAFDIVNTPLGGMVQFIPSGNPALLKPQYYDNTQWVDFANSTDTYLEDITIVGDEYTFVMNGHPNIVITIPDTYYPSSGTQYKVQLSNGDNSFIHSDNLSWNLYDYLNINGAIKLESRDLGDFSGVTNSIVHTGTHIYANINGTFRQLDNEPTDGEANHGESIGSAVEVYAGMNLDNHNLKFYDLKGNTKINISDANEFGNILFDVDYSVYGASLGSVGTPVYVNTTDTINESILNFKKLYSSDSSIAFTDMGDYINMVVVGLNGTGEANSGSNIGDGTGLSYSGKNGLLLEFRTIKGVDNLNVTTVGNTIEIIADTFVEAAANVGLSGISVYKDYTDASSKRTLNFRNISGHNGIETTVSESGNILYVGLNETLYVPSLEGVQLPVSTNADKTLTWSLNYTPDILDATPVLEPIAQLNLGSNLIYNSTTNTLDSIGGVGNPLKEIYNYGITRSPDGTVDRPFSTRLVDFKLNDNTIIRWDGETSPFDGLGWLAFENDYPIGSDTQKGILQVDVSGALNVLNGVLSIDMPTIPDSIDAVLYSPSGYNLHDYDAGNDGSENGETILIRRNRARASIGGAYVNGRVYDPFQAAQLVIGSNTGDFEQSGYVGGIKGLYMYNNKIASDWVSTEIVKPKSTTPTNDTEATKLVIMDGNMDLVLDPRATGNLGNFNFYIYNTAGTKIKVASIKGRYENGELLADFRLKGDIKFHCTDAEMNV